jgi:hypothetical protein
MLTSMKLIPVIALTLATAPNLAAADPVKVAVVPGLAVNVDSARVDALCQDLAEALVSELVVEAAGGLEVRRQLHEGLPPDCVATPACTAGVAKATGASQLLFVVIVDSGATGSVQVDTTWVDAATGQAASRPAIALTSTSDIDAKAKFATYAKQLLPDAPVRPKPKTGITNLVGGKPRHITRGQILTASVGVVAIGWGIGWGLSAGSHFKSCNADPNNCTKSQRDTITRLDLTADIGWIVAAGAAITTAILYTTSAEAPHVAPVVTPGGAGVAFSVSF